MTNTKQTTCESDARPVHEPNGLTLLELAMQQPGVAEVLAFHRRVQETQDIVAAYFVDATDLPVQSTTSDSTV